MGTLLVVDDEPRVRTVLVQGLELHGHRVLEAEDAESALAVAADHAGTIEALITDAFLPGMSGTDLARRFLEEYPGTKVLLISGRADEVVRSLPLDRVDFMQKPFTPTSLARKLRDLFDRQDSS